MIRPNPISRRAMIDALRHMARVGHRPADLLRLAGVKRSSAIEAAMRDARSLVEARK